MYGKKIIGLGAVKKVKPPITYTLKTTEGQPVLFIVGEPPYGIEEKSIYKKDGYFINPQLGFHGLLTAHFKDNKTLKKIVNKKYHKELKEQGLK